MKNNKVEIVSATIRWWGFKRKKDRIYPYFNLTTHDKEDYTLSSEKEVTIAEFASILNVLNVINTKDIVNLGCRVALRKGIPFAIGNVTDSRWLVFEVDEYFMMASDTLLDLFI